jgi:adenylyl-sulfate kinase
MKVNEAQSRSLVIWLTGLSGAGKSTLSARLKPVLVAHGIPLVQIDGDALRAGLNKDLGFSQEARDENIRRAAEIAKLIADQGVLVVCSFISPLQRQRQMARDIIGDGFVEVHLHLTVDEAIERDPKGLYKRALAGEIKDFTGISSDYEHPEAPEVRIHTGSTSEDDSVDMIVEMVLRRISDRPLQA